MQNWREYYFFNHETRRCELFWYDGCEGNSENIFASLDTCENMCEITSVLDISGQS